MLMYHWFCLLHSLEINAKILGRLQIGPSAPRMHKVPKLFENPESSLCFKKTPRWSMCFALFCNQCIVEYYEYFSITMIIIICPAYNPNSKEISNSHPFFSAHAASLQLRNPDASLNGALQKHDFIKSHTM